MAGNWEWRIFFELDDDDDDKAPYSILSDNQLDCGMEERVDIYKSLGHPSLGLKARGNDTFHEIKVQIDADNDSNDDDGDDGWQCWIKCFAEPSHTPAQLESQIKHCATLKRIDKRLYEHATLFASQHYNATTTTIPSIRFEKRRIQIYDPEDGILEQTDLKLFDSCGTFMGKYRTICVEENTCSQRPQRIRKEMGNELLSKATTMIGGYPTLVERLLERYSTSNNAVAETTTPSISSSLHSAMGEP